MLEITSVHNPRIKAAAKLRESKERAATGLFLIEGRRELQRAIVGQIEIMEIFVHEGSGDCNSVLQQIRPLHGETYQVNSAAFEKLSFGNRNEGLIAVARAPIRRLDDLKLPSNPLIAVLEGIEKPGNLGAVLRTADASGVSAVIVADGGTDLWNPNAIRASLGAIFTVPVCAASSTETLAWLQAAGVSIFATRVDGACTYTRVPLHGPAAIVFGSEAQGLSGAWHSPAITSIALPMLGEVDSLNVSATAAILFYEAVRQRTLAE